MKHHATALIAIALIASGMSLAAEPLVVFRDAENSLSAQSQRSLQEMSRYARKHGQIRVWVDFGIAFTADPELRTPEVVAQEQALLEQRIAEIVQPLIDDGLATRIEVTPYPAAPGLMLHANARAIRSLGRSEKVKYIGQLLDTS